MTLNELIKKATAISRRFTTGDIPLYINGREVDIKLKEVEVNDNYRIIMDIVSRAEELTELRILDEVQVTVKHWKRFNEMLSQGLLKAVTVANGNTVHLEFSDNHTIAHTNDWLILDEQKRWWVMNGEYHKDMVNQGKLIKV